jgi:hypothetical protein
VAAAKDARRGPGRRIVLGARIPIILTSRADTVLARMASCVVALIAGPA